MLYTNGKILIEKQNNAKALAEAVEKLTKFLLTEKGLKAEFLPTTEYKFPAFLIPQGVTYKDMDDCLRPMIALRAINEEEIILSGTRSVNVKYSFTEDELRDLADKLVNNLTEQMSLEGQKSAVAKEYAGRIEMVEKEVRKLTDKIRQKVEYRDYECDIKLNFADKKKYYMDRKEEGTVRKIEDLSYDDFQLKIDHRAELTVEQTEGVVDAGDADSKAVGKDKKVKKMRAETTSENAGSGEEDGNMADLEKGEPKIGF